MFKQTVVLIYLVGDPNAEGVPAPPAVCRFFSPALPTADADSARTYGLGS